MNQKLDIQIIAIIFKESPMLFLLVFLPLFALGIYFMYKYTLNPGKYKLIKSFFMLCIWIGVIYAVYDWINTIEERVQHLEDHIDLAD